MIVAHRRNADADDNEYDDGSSQLSGDQWFLRVRGDGSSNDSGRRQSSTVVIGLILASSSRWSCVLPLSQQLQES